MSNLMYTFIVQLNLHQTTDSKAQLTTRSKEKIMSRVTQQGHNQGDTAVCIRGYGGKVFKKMLLPLSNLVCKQTGKDYLMNYC